MSKEHQYLTGKSDPLDVYILKEKLVQSSEHWYNNRCCSTLNTKLFRILQYSAWNAYLNRMLFTLEKYSCLCLHVGSENESFGLLSTTARTFSALDFVCNNLKCYEHMNTCSLLVMETYIKIFWVLHVKVEIYTIIIYTPEWNIFYYIYICVQYMYILFKHLHDSWVLENSVGVSASFFSISY